MIDFYYDRPYNIKRTELVYKKSKRVWDIDPAPKGGKTFAVQKIRQTGFYLGMEVILNIGLARCHKDDAFVKKTGRELSVNNMLPVAFKITKLIIEEKQIILSLKSKDFIVELSFIQGKEFSRLDYVEEV